MVLLREVYYNTYGTIHTALYVGTTYIYNTSTGRLQYRHIYNTDTVHLQGALIHTALYVIQLIFTIHPQVDYNTDTVHLQGALIHTLLFISHTHIRTILIFLIS